MVPNTVSFVPALNDLASVSAILVKPKTKTRDEYQILNREGFRLLDLDRSWAASPVEVNKTLIDLGLTQKNIVILDIGGYFAGSIDEVAKLFDGQILGVMEGTENGLRRYEANPPTSVPVITVARSPLKLPEDYLVGSSVVFSIEATLREQAEILQTRTATVVGYRFDPYKNYKFRVKWDGVYVAGISKVSGLSRTTQVVMHRSGGDPSTPRLSPGQSEFSAITLERGVTHDVNFEQWANKVWDYTNSTKGDDNSNQLVSLKDFRKDIIIEVYNEAGQKVLAYFVYRCWVSEYQAMPELDAMGSAVAIQHMKLENEGWERDTSVTEPTEGSYTLPAS
jgi:phage tail-like protein